MKFHLELGIFSELSDVRFFFLSKCNEVQDAFLLLSTRVRGVLRGVDLYFGRLTKALS